MLSKLLRWAYLSIDKSINQPTLPHVIIVLNATEGDVDEKQWGFDFATDKLLEDYKNSFHGSQELRDIVDGLNGIGNTISLTKELLEFYYSSITVFGSLPRIATCTC